MVYGWENSSFLRYTWRQNGHRSHLAGQGRSRSLLTFLPGRPMPGSGRPGLERNYRSQGEYGQMVSIWRPSLSSQGKILFLGRTVYAFHGNEIPSFSPEKGDIVMSGHTHIPSFRNKDGVFYVNPGSASQPRTSLPPSFALISEECFTLFSLLDLSIISRRSFSSSQ